MSKTSVLIVEDEAVVAADLAGKLRRLGYTIAATAHTGEEAIALAREHRPSLVLMDISLAGPMDGIAAAEVIQRECDVPVIFMTAHADEATVTRARNTAAVGYIMKPFQPHELHIQAELALHQYEVDRELRARDRQLLQANSELTQRAAELQAANEALSESRRAALNLMEDAQVARRQAEHALAERNRAEAAILRAKQEWERTFDTVPDLIAILDREHRIVRVNRAMAARLGKTPAECIGLMCYESLHGRTQPIEGCPHALTMADGHGPHAPGHLRDPCRAGVTGGKRAEVPRTRGERQQRDHAADAGSHHYVL